jgi:iron complex outermembrane receptor protein
MDLDREIDDLDAATTTHFAHEFDATTWRLGATFEVWTGTTLYGQYTQAVVPVSTLVLSNLSNGKFDLSTGESYEAGVKSILFGGTLVTTAAIYQIDQDNILTRDPSNPALVVQGGSQRSRGIEVDAALALTDRWNLYAAGSLIDAEFTSLRNAIGDLTGNRPVNVPPYTLYISTDYRLESMPATIGASIYSVGDFYTDTANTIEVEERCLLDAWIAYDLSEGTLRLRGRNLTDEFYAHWSGYSSTQVYLGAPRGFDITYTAKW